MKHSISIQVINNPVGIASSSDGVMMMFIKGIAIGSTLALNTAYLLTSWDDAQALGVSQAIDEANNVAMYQQLNEFYDNGINDGALLWVVFVAKATAYASYIGSEQMQGLVRYTAMADPANRAKMIGFCYEVPTTQQNANDFPADVTNSIPVIQATQSAMFQQGYQWSAILDGYNMSSTVSPSGIQTMANKSAQSVSLCITGTQPNGVSGVGLALGRFARIGIGHGFGEVADGAVTTNTAYLTNGVVVGENIVSGTGGVLVVGTTYIVLNAPIIYNGVTYQVGDEFIAVTGHTSFTTSAGGYVAAGGTPVGTLSPTEVDQLGEKQYLFLRTWLNRSGFYWNDGATCTDPTLQLATQEYNRVANSLSADALNFFIGEMGKNLPLDVSTGNVSSTYLLAKQAEFYEQYISPLTVAAGSGDITDGSITITGVNFNATKTLNFTLRIVPTPILGNVNGVVEFSSTL
jgi:hypothetical protein